MLESLSEDEKKLQEVRYYNVYVYTHVHVHAWYMYIHVLCVHRTHGYCSTQCILIWFHMYIYCLLRRRIKGAARAFYSHNVRLDVQRLWDIRCFMIFHIVQEVRSPETVRSNAARLGSRHRRSRGATASSCLFENP